MSQNSSIGDFVMRTLNLNLLERKGLNDLLTMAEMCEVFGRSRSSIYRYMNDLSLGFPQPVPLLGGQLNFRAEDVREYINKCFKLADKNKEKLRQYRVYG